MIIRSTTMNGAWLFSHFDEVIIIRNDNDNDKGVLVALAWPMAHSLSTSRALTRLSTLEYLWQLGVYFRIMLWSRSLDKYEIYM